MWKISEAEGRGQMQARPAIHTAAIDTFPHIGKVPAMTSAGWKSLLDARREQHLDELLALLRIPSVSTDPAHRDDVRTTAGVVGDRLAAAGVPVVDIIETPLHPVVLGEWHVGDDMPTVLIYGHYDVQPETPVELWESPAFEPTIRDGKIYARGSSDMKGNLLTAIQGVEAVAEANGGQPPVNVKFLFEGEEEIGSPNLREVVRQHRARLAADAVISADGGQFGPETPSLTVALKGLGGCQVNLRTANTDLHSGMFGAKVPNAVQAMVHLAASFHNQDGRIAIEGFYDNVVDLTAAERAEIALLAEDEEALKAQLGIDALWGEPGWTAREREWGRPTLDLNGIWGGFQGDGIKTVTPSEAHLKITCRLVPNQTPDGVVDLIRAHVEAHRPPGATVEVVRLPGSATPFAIDRDNAVHKAAEVVLTDLFGTAPVITRSGGTIPATGIFQDELGIDTVNYAWAMPGSGAHAPNEWYRVEDFERGRAGYAALIEYLGGQAG
jgi:acetylornithine deacetylase/succinyl-diaminopimelate desuccinylase-like protein